jgi:hypothetical protein
MCILSTTKLFTLNDQCCYFAHGGNHPLVILELHSPCLTIAEPWPEDRMQLTMLEILLKLALRHSVLAVACHSSDKTGSAEHKWLVKPSYQLQ